MWKNHKKSLEPPVDTAEFAQIEERGKDIKMSLWQLMVFSFKCKLHSINHIFSNLLLLNCIFSHHYDVLHIVIYSSEYALIIFSNQCHGNSNAQFLLNTQVCGFEQQYYCNWRKV